MSRLVAHLKSNVVGYLALFVALGGTSYAAVSIPDHSIGTRKLAAHAVGQKQLQYASVGSRQLRKGSVRGLQINPGAVGTAQLAAGAVGVDQLNGSQIPAYVRAFAVVDSSGGVEESSPQASALNWGPTGGLVSFGVPIGNCGVSVTPLDLTVPVSATIQVGGINVQYAAPGPHAVSVAVICAG